MAALKINESDGVKALQKLVSNFTHCWSHPIAQAHFTGVTVLTDMGNVSTGAVAGRIGNHNNCMSIHCPFVLNAAHFPGEALPVVDGTAGHINQLKLYALRVRSFKDIFVQISRDAQMLLKSVKTSAQL